MGRIAVGRVLGAHGIRGEVVVSRFGDAPGLLVPGASFTAQRAGRDMVLTVDAARPHKGGWIVSFGGIGGRSEAEMLAGLELEVDESTLPPLEEGTYYQYRLIGLEVATTEGETVGKVAEVLSTGANDVFVVRGPRGEVLIPAVEPIVTGIDIEAGRVVIDPPPGLLPGAGGGDGAA